jgi:Rv2525c-like, glycoside hydrolase-like domain
MLRFGLDYAWTTISPASHRAVGSSFACRYLSDSSKDLSAAEARQLKAGGISIVVVWETTATRALDGTSAGAVDAHDALAEATRLGMPAGRPIYFAVDFDETPGEVPSVADYFKGVNSVLGVARTGVYGGFWVVSRLFDEGHVKYGWQTYAWSGGQWDSRAQIQQFSNGHLVAGQSCDYDHAIYEDFGQWDFKSPPAPASAPKGVFLYEHQINLSTGKQRVQGLPNAGVVLGGPDRWASVKGGYNSETGVWLPVEPLEWNAPPLGK